MPLNFSMLLRPRNMVFESKKCWKIIAKKCFDFAFWWWQWIWNKIFFKQNVCYAQNQAKSIVKNCNKLVNYQKYENIYYNSPIEKQHITWATSPVSHWNNNTTYLNCWNCTSKEIAHLKKLNIYEIADLKKLNICKIE